MVDEILEKYPNDVKVVVKNFPLGSHKQARKAAAYALAAREQGGVEAVSYTHLTLPTNREV